MTCFRSYRLEYLDIEHQILSGKELTILARSCPSLQLLKLYGIQWHEDMALEDKLGRFPKLETLSVLAFCPYDIGHIEHLPLDDQVRRTVNSSLEMFTVIFPQLTRLYTDDFVDQEHFEVYMVEAWKKRKGLDYLTFEDGHVPEAELQRKRWGLNDGW
ncbi:hypothetical protein AUEXF2481DRAFT_462637 [Aureobasidium subglaciale EXF-2481]|uniref:F-box domain-containing protein n=1 Tax=Aureobasidium subglaciale (strain EXF-2481) TaxID=1043005 RepID=A0A074YXP0_AURSE|nr:uncharacterized protein AUEXF2481DRAFT_462637 [Aureobasidium subglaciale EXF-2481]KEQ91596.1 hypothetical protein AUEXF2481DRAFT_462637 [Aureobasidium subglaciale EXF-2481]